MRHVVSEKKLLKEECYTYLYLSVLRISSVSLPLLVNYDGDVRSGTKFKRTRNDAIVMHPPKKIVNPSNPLSSRSMAVLSVHRKNNHFPDGDLDKIRCAIVMMKPFDKYKNLLAIIAKNIVK